MLGVVWNFLAKNFCPSPPQILVEKVRRFRAGVDTPLWRQCGDEDASEAAVVVVGEEG